MNITCRSLVAYVITVCMDCWGPLVPEVLASMRKQTAVLVLGMPSMAEEVAVGKRFHQRRK